MKLSKLIIPMLIMTVGVFTETMYATPFVQESNVTSNTYMVLKRKMGNKHNDRPNAPDRQRIICAYGEGVITFNFVIPEGECFGSVTDMRTGYIYPFSFDSSTLVAEVEVNEISDFYIEITTEKGNTYLGVSSDEL